MRSDRYTKIVITLIAIGLWALTLTQLEPSQASAEWSGPSGVFPVSERAESVGDYSPDDGGTRPEAGTSSLPLRWRVRNVPLYYFPNKTYCIPIISVRNLGPSSTNVEVEFFSDRYTSPGKKALSIGAGSMKVLLALIPGVASWGTPFLETDLIEFSGNFSGFAQVHSDDPRIDVAAFLRCDSHPSDPNPTSVNSLPADPVGTTMQFFQAGMPATWAPPMVVPEVPE